MAGPLVQYYPEVSYDDYLKALRSATVDANFNSDIKYIRKIAEQVAQFVSDSFMSCVGTPYSDSRCSITTRITPAERDPKTKESLDYSRYHSHIELFHTQTKQMVRILPSPTRQDMCFVSYYEMAGPAHRRVSSETVLVYEGIVQMDKLLTATVCMTLYHFLNRENGKSVMDFSDYFRLH